MEKQSRTSNPTTTGGKVLQLIVALLINAALAALTIFMSTMMGWVSGSGLAYGLALAALFIAIYALLRTGL